jgi:hypothetical protein
VAARPRLSQNRYKTPNKEVGINHITVYVSGNTETDTTNIFSQQRPNVWRQKK